MRRRRLSQMLLLAMTMLVAMVLVAGPSFAADETEDHSDEEGYDDGKESTSYEGDAMTAVGVAAAAGIVLGGFAYSQSEPGGIERVSDDHH